RRAPPPFPTRRSSDLVRGEHSNGVRPPLRPRGSSPRARGARGERVAAQGLAGIIPACAGSTLDDQRIYQPAPQNSFTLCLCQSACRLGIASRGHLLPPSARALLAFELPPFLAAFPHGFGADARSAAGARWFPPPERGSRTGGSSEERRV